MQTDDPAKNESVVRFEPAVITIHARLDAVIVKGDPQQPPPVAVTGSGNSVIPGFTSSAQGTVGQPPAKPSPSSRADFLIDLVYPDRAEEILGDFTERYYGRWLPKYGEKRARVLYVGNILRTLGPVAFQVLWKLGAVFWLWRRGS